MKINPFMAAHGDLPGPTQRPVLAGFLSGLLAAVCSIPVFWLTGAAQALAHGTGTSPLTALSAQMLIMLLGAILYARIFRRAANDRRGGWLFGISYGYFLWMLGPVTLLQFILRRPLATGLPAFGILAAHLLFGLVLGITFPWLHYLVRAKLSPQSSPGSPAG